MGERENRLTTGITPIVGGAGGRQRQAPPRLPEAPAQWARAACRKIWKTGSEVGGQMRTREGRGQPLLRLVQGSLVVRRGEERGQALCHLSLGQSLGLGRAMAIVLLPPSRPRAHPSFYKLPPGDHAAQPGGQSPTPTEAQIRGACVNRGLCRLLSLRATFVHAAVCSKSCSFPFLPAIPLYNYPVIYLFIRLLKGREVVPSHWLLQVELPEHSGTCLWVGVLTPFEPVCA